MKRLCFDLLLLTHIERLLN